MNKRKRLWKISIPHNEEADKILRDPYISHVKIADKQIQGDISVPPCILYYPAISTGMPEALALPASSQSGP